MAFSIDDLPKSAFSGLDAQQPTKSEPIKYEGTEGLLRAKADEYGIDPDLFVGLGRRESGLNPSAKNPESTAGGVFQFLDGTWKQYGRGDKFDPEANADAAARMLRDNLNRFGGDYNHALAAHHVGPGKAKEALLNSKIGDVNVSTQKWLSDIYGLAGKKPPEKQSNEYQADSVFDMSNTAARELQEQKQAKSDANPIETSFKRGWNQMTDSVANFKDVIADNPDAIIKRMDAAQEFDRANPSPSANKQWMKDWEDSNTTGWMTNPSGFFGNNVEQLANSAPSMIGSIPAGIAGAQAGAPLGPWGIALGGLFGATLGSAPGSVFTEGGGRITEMMMRDGVDPSNFEAVRPWLEANKANIIKEGVAKGSVVALADGAAQAVGMGLLTKPAMKFAQAETKTLVGMGVTRATAAPEALAAARNSITYKTAMAAPAAELKAASTLGQKAARGTAAFMADGAGEFSGEYFGEELATGNGNFDNALLEMVMSFGQSAVTTGAQAIGASFIGNKANNANKSFLDELAAFTPTPVNSPLTGAANTTQLAGEQVSIAQQASATKDPFVDLITPISARFEDRDLFQSIRQHPNLGPDALTDVLGAYRVATNVNLEPAQRQAAIDRLNGFLTSLDNQPNFTAGNPDTPQNSVVPFNQPSTGVGPVDPRVGSIDGEATQLADTALPAPNVAIGSTNQPQSPVKQVEDTEFQRRAKSEYESAFQDLVKAEQMGASVYAQNIAAQKLHEAELRLQQVNETVDGNRAIETAQKRDTILKQALDGMKLGQNPLRAFDRALRAAGFTDAKFTESEKEKIARWSAFNSIPQSEFDRYAAEQAAPNELVIPERKAPTVKAKEGFPHIDAAISRKFKFNGKVLTNPKTGKSRTLKQDELAYYLEKVNAAQVDAQGNQGQRDVGTGSEGNSPALPVVEQGRSGDATAPVSDAGAVAPVGSTRLADGDVDAQNTQGTTLPAEPVSLSVEGQAAQEPKQTGQVPAVPDAAEQSDVAAQEFSKEVEAKIAKVSGLHGKTTDETRQLYRKLIQAKTAEENGNVAEGVASANRTLDTTIKLGEQKLADEKAATEKKVKDAAEAARIASIDSIKNGKKKPLAEIAAKYKAESKGSVAPQNSATAFAEPVDPVQSGANAAQEPSNGTSKGTISPTSVGRDAAKRALKSIFEANAVEFNMVDPTASNWIELFGDNHLVSTPLGDVKVSENQFHKMLARDGGDRAKFISMIKPTLERPVLVIEKTDSRGKSVSYMKSFVDKQKIKYFMSVIVDKDGINVSISNSPKDLSGLLKEVMVGTPVYDPFGYVERVSAETSTTGIPSGSGLTSTIANQPQDGNTEMDALQAEMGQAIGELASILGAKNNLTPEEESQIIPVMSKIFRIAAKMGYIKFKDAARYVFGQTKSLAGDEVANKLSIENLQAGYLNIITSIEGASSKIEVVSVPDLDSLSFSPSGSVDSRFDEVMADVAPVEQAAPTDATKPLATFEEGKTALRIIGDPAFIKERLDAIGIKSVPRKDGVNVPDKKRWADARANVPVSIDQRTIDGVPARLADVTLETMENGNVRLISPSETGNYASADEAVKYYRESYKDSPETVDQPAEEVAIPAALEDKPVHIENGEVEAATPAVIEQSLKKSVAMTSGQLKEAQKWLEGEIDKAMVGAMDGMSTEYKGKQADMPFVTFDVPGDGAFKIPQFKGNLERFKGRIKTGAFVRGHTPKLQKTSPADRTGTSGTESSIADFLDDGDYLTALEFSKQINKPIIFGWANPAKSDHPIAYVGAKPFKIEGFDDFNFVSAKSILEKGNGWMVLELSTGNSINGRAQNNRNDAEQAALTQFEVNKVTPELLREKVASFTKQGLAGTQEALEAQWVEWAEKAEAEKDGIRADDQANTKMLADQFEKANEEDVKAEKEAADKAKYAAKVAEIKAKQAERAIVPLADITLTRTATLDGKPVEYDQKADEALNEVDNQMTLARQLLNCLAA